jgi:hypothetical protein
MRCNLPHCRKLVLFVLLSLADLYLTWTLLSEDESAFYESNPVAGWWLQHHGWLGMASFKAATVLVAGTIFVVVSRYRPQTAGKALYAGCCAVGAVVLYSCYLARADAQAASETQPLVETGEEIDQAYRHLRDYINLRVRLVEEVVHERCTLSAAVDQMTQTERFRAGKTVGVLQKRYPGYSLEECVATQIMINCIEKSQPDRSAIHRLGSKLEGAFEERFGRPSPTLYHQLLRRSGIAIQRTAQ